MKLLGGKGKGKGKGKGDADVINLRIIIIYLCKISLCKYFSHCAVNSERWPLLALDMRFSKIYDVIKIKKQHHKNKHYQLHNV